MIVDDLISAANLTGDQTKDQWREVIAAVVFNGKPADLACLDELGARFRRAGLNYPAHVWSVTTFAILAVSYFQSLVVTFLTLCGCHRRRIRQKRRFDAERPG